MGFRKTHRRTKKRGGTRQRGGMNDDGGTDAAGGTDAPPIKAELVSALDIAKAAFDRLTPDDKKDLNNQVVQKFIDAYIAVKNYNKDKPPDQQIDLSSVPQAIIIAAEAEAVAGRVDEKLFKDGEKKKFVENLAKVLKTIYDNMAEEEAPNLDDVVNAAFSSYNDETKAKFDKCFTKDGDSVNLIEDELVEILKKSNTENPVDGLFHELKTQGEMGGGGKRRKTRRRRRRHGKKKAKKTHHKKKRKSRRKKRNTRRKRHY